MQTLGLEQMQLVQELLPGRTAWCAGYPRSGTSLVRLILAHCFGHYTASVYNESLTSGGFSGAVRLLPHVNDLDAVEAIGAEQGLLFWKTHACLTDTSPLPAIIIVRDGRRVLSSLEQFYATFNSINLGMRDMIAGNHPWGSWSAWVRSWEQNAGPHALWLRHADVVADVPGTVDRIAARFGLKPVAHSIPAFEELHAADPSIWRAGDTETNGGMTLEDEQLFWALHGDAMARHGYFKEAPRADIV